MLKKVIFVQTSCNCVSVASPSLIARVPSLRYTYNKTRYSANFVPLLSAQINRTPAVSRTVFDMTPNNAPVPIGAPTPTSRSSTRRNVFALAVWMENESNWIHNVANYGA